MARATVRSPMKLLYMVPSRDMTKALGQPPDLLRAGFHEFPVARFPSRLRFRLWCKFEVISPKRTRKLRVKLLSSDMKLLFEAEEAYSLAAGQTSLTWSPVIDFKVTVPKKITVSLSLDGELSDTWPFVVCRRTE